MGWLRKTQKVTWEFSAEEILKFYDKPKKLIGEIQDEIDEQSNFLEYATKKLTQQPEENLDSLGNLIEHHLNVICNTYILFGMLREISDEVASLVLTKKASPFALDASQKSHDVMYDFIDDVKGRFKSDLIALGVGKDFAIELIKSAWLQAANLQPDGIESIEQGRDGANEWDWINSSSWHVRNPIEYEANFVVAIDATSDKLRLLRKTNSEKSQSSKNTKFSPRRFPTKAELEAMKKAGVSKGDSINTNPRLFPTKAEQEAMRAARGISNQDPED